MSQERALLSRQIQKAQKLCSIDTKQTGSGEDGSDQEHTQHKTVMREGGYLVLYFEKPGHKTSDTM